MAPACHHPSLLVIRYGDLGYTYPLLIFHADGPVGGATELWYQLWSRTALLSPDDGVPSAGGNLGGFFIEEMTCNNMPGSFTPTRACWVDGEGDQDVIRTAWVRDPSKQGGDTLDVDGPAATAIGAREGYPQATMLQVWSGMHNGAPALLAREGARPDASGTNSSR
mgnify:CR=1 FL=1